MDRLEEIRARLAAATPGPWAAIQKTWRSRTSGYTWSAYGIEQAEEVYGDDAKAISYATDAGQIAQNDADLIAHAPADLTYLLAELERANRRAARWKYAARINRSLRKGYYRRLVQMEVEAAFHD